MGFRKTDMRLALMICIALSLLMSLASVPAEAQSQNAPAGDRIVFLHLQIDKAGVTLIDSRVVDGKLKIEKIVSRSIGLSLKANSGSSQNYYTNIVENPLIKRYEYEDPNNAGQLITKIVLLDEAEFWVRIPYQTDLNSIAFSLTDGQLESFSRGRAAFESVIDLSFLAEGAN